MYVYCFFKLIKLFTCKHQLFETDLNEYLSKLSVAKGSKQSDIIIQFSLLFLTPALLNQRLHFCNFTLIKYRFLTVASKTNAHFHTTYQKSATDLAETNDPIKRWLVTYNNVYFFILRWYMVV